MPILVDTNILLRLRDPTDPDHDKCRRALEREMAQRHSLSLCAQVLIEYWSAATRPAAQNGFGLSIVEARDDLLVLLSFIRLVRLINAGMAAACGPRAANGRFGRGTGSAAWECVMLML